MATGIPKTKWNGPKPAQNEQGCMNDVRVAYEGKKPEQRILEMQPARCRLLWPPHCESKGQSRLYFGDNLGILAALATDSQVRGKIRLVYIDPPYATKSVFQSRKQ